MFSTGVCDWLLQTTNVELITEDDAFLYFEDETCRYSLFWMRHFLPKVREFPLPAHISCPSL